VEEIAMDQETLDDWNRRLGTEPDEKATIFKEMVDLATIVHVFSEIREMIQSNPKLQRHSAFYNVHGLNHAHSVLMYIRRQVRTDGNSLRRLLQDIRDNHQLVTREWFVSMYTERASDRLEEIREQQANHDFNKHFAKDEDSEYIDANIIDEDIERLQEIYESTKDLVDARVAHTVPQREPDRIPTYDQLSEWAKEVGCIFNKYLLLLQGAGLDRLIPHFSHDWKEIFRHAWLPDDNST
jgi:hypothetical protein